MKNYFEHDDPENRKGDRRSAFDKANTTRKGALRGCYDIDDAKLASTVDKADLARPTIVQALAARALRQSKRPPDLPDGQITEIAVQPSPQK